MKYEIRTEKVEDYSAIREINIQAFNYREDEAKLVESIRESEFFIPELSLVAVNEESELVGHILFSRITIETNNCNISTIGLAPMAVKPNLQNKGIGSDLVIKGLEVCKSLGYKHVIVLGHPNFYPRFGFIPAKNYSIKAPFDVPDEVFMALELEKGSLRALEGTVQYPPAFRSVS